MLESLKSEMRR